MRFTRTALRIGNRLTTLYDAAKVKFFKYIIRYSKDTSLAPVSMKRVYNKEISSERIYNTGIQ
jgi:hypothetical protein